MLRKFPNNFKVYLFQLPIFNKCNHELNRMTCKKNNIYNKIGDNIIKYFSSIEKFKLLREVLGVYHMKFYIADNNILLTGANLSEEYLTKRQDRYILLRDVPEICDYLSKISDIVQEYSYTLKPNNKLQFPKKEDIYIMRENMLKLNKDINWLKDLIYSFERQHDEDFIKKYKNKIIFGILLQAGYMNINSERNLVKYLINSCIKDIGLYICTPYCNMSTYWTNLMKFNSNPLVIVTSGRKSSTFSKLKEPIYLNILDYIKTLVIPLYSSINSEFIKDIIYNSNHKQREVEFGEYERDEWTFHAKGIYFYKYKKEPTSNSMKNENDETDYFPKYYERRIFANYLGSSNYNHRGESRDLECSFLLLTNGNKEIQENLNKEWYENIYRYLKREKESKDFILLIGS
ncbi:CDP-diacylglycerol-glycerol-3-phosphate 3-phosphatidyltransferase [Cryptosporidium andersoni]|uniref:CDP-diacylglycerol--glycerol-3-phosphate 3-phosphatidyltransferase n=1 Tax=Cryptosporidium andersoni TaxID=117008 RepID=A0A1J4MPC4_9CRYT|nr:CDP-diacylglycerol-glycerol-3-phosphate 3-phosphatidyltransferase [Cryptosporidium andersoni]